MRRRQERQGKGQRDGKEGSNLARPVVCSLGPAWRDSTDLARARACVRKYAAARRRTVRGGGRRGGRREQRHCASQRARAPPSSRASFCRLRCGVTAAAVNSQPVGLRLARVVSVPGLDCVSSLNFETPLRTRCLASFDSGITSRNTAGGGEACLTDWCLLGLSGSI